MDVKVEVWTTRDKLVLVKGVAPAVPWSILKALQELVAHWLTVTVWGRTSTMARWNVSELIYPDKADMVVDISAPGIAHGQAVDLGEKVLKFLQTTDLTKDFPRLCVIVDIVGDSAYLSGGRKA